MTDRRSKQRLSVHLNATWDRSSEAHGAQITNLSEGGCYLDSVGEVKTGEIVGFRVLLPDDDWLYLQGEVRHHELAGFGVQFVDLNDEQKEKLQWLLSLAARDGANAEPMAAHLVEDE